ncbi:hypothetical protein [uncultured Rhodoblastus sp.]|jgi:predicted DNA-binding transcriptional regulator AlpA|uniref:helix-turn-helix transcriptional regulator n=1 Tax=uncultured Rhodoblastus sp. TaxID=543037 RepID=UPI0025E5096F|nr:hypothetical protein [uncultured Rhodoblastus sp.]
METFEFSIIASGLDPQADDFETRFFDAGCDDATVSFQKGRIIIDFMREAESFQAAISSAIDNVIAAGATIDHVEPGELVSLNEIASRTGLSRAAVSHYAQGKRGDEFPAPYEKVTSKQSLWRWPPVSKWLFKRSQVGKSVVIQAELVAYTNNQIRKGSLPSQENLEQEAARCVAELCD